MQYVPRNVLYDWCVSREYCLRIYDSSISHIGIDIPQAYGL